MRHFPISILAAALLLATSLVPRTAHAVALLEWTCSEAADVLISDDIDAQLSVASQMVGTVAMLGNLLCFVGDPGCTCFRNINDFDSVRNVDFVEEVAEILSDCADGPNGGRSLSGVSQEAALATCR